MSTFLSAIQFMESEMLLEFSLLPPIEHLSQQTGPPLDRLPEELLPALGKFLYIGRDAAEQGSINREGMEQLQAIIKCLTVLCLNTHNIPLVASIDLVKHVGANNR